MQLPFSLRARSPDLCSIEYENRFGPVVNGCADNFDFTLLFEELSLSIALSALFIPIMTASLFYSRHQAIKLTASWIVTSKLIVHVSHVVVQLTLLLLWALPTTPKTNASLASASLSTLLAIGLGCLSYREHFRNVRPSKTLSLYFFFSVLLDIPRSRTLFVVSGLHEAIPITFLVCMLSRVLMVSLEAVEKRRWIRQQYLEGSPETTAGPFNRALLVWLNQLFLLGSRKTLIMEDLFAAERAMVPVAAAMRRGSDSLLIHLIKMFSREILRGVIPRSAQIGFTLAQPYIIQRALVLLAAPNVSDAQSQGVALVAAFAIVYIGYAVSKITSFAMIKQDDLTEC